MASIDDGGSAAPDSREGVVEVTGEGHLLVRIPTGDVRRVPAGDVVHLRPL